MDAFWNQPAAEALGLRFDRPMGRIAAALVLAALWLLGRRYGGITHDATLYVAQALHRLDPRSFEHDLFFAHGSQDAYSLFSLLYAPLVHALGPAYAAMATTMLGQIAFVAGAWALIGRLAPASLPRSVRWWSLALLALISGYYGGGGVFRFAEPFATARTLAEPLVLAALACTLASRTRTAIAALALAALLHPLVAAPGCAVLLLWHAMERRAWLLGLCAAGLAAGIGAFAWPGYGPRLDAPWMQALLERSPHLFVTYWPLPDWARILWGLCVAWLATRFMQAPARRLVIAALAVAAAGIAASALAVDLLHNAFAAGLQMWRAHWLMQLFAIMALPIAAAGLWRSGGAARLAAACLAASCCFGRSEQLFAALLALAAAGLHASERRWPGWMGERLFRLALVAPLAAAAAGLLFEVQSRLPLEYVAAGTGSWTDYLPAATSLGVLLPLAALVWLGAHSRLEHVVSVAAALLLAGSLAAWDARKPWSRFVERETPQSESLRRALSPGAEVFWADASSPAWLLLRTPNWFSADQGAGIVFNRETALEYSARKQASRDLRSANADCLMRPDGKACAVDALRARALCARRDGPDYLVLDEPVEGRSFQAELVDELGSKRRSFYVYACTAL